MAPHTTVAERSRKMWSTRLSSAMRTAFACGIVGVATLYGPKFLASHIKFSAFSYLTAVLIASDASVGDAVRGCWHAFCGTVQVVPAAMLWWWMVGPMAELPLAAVVVGVAAMAVALPECTDITAKRIAFGQIVLICTDAVVNDGSSDELMHPLYIAASTALGALASLVAVLLPYPALATNKIRELCVLYGENASQRMNIYLRALVAPDQHAKMDLISQAKPLSETGAKLLHSITILQEGMQWESPWRRVGPIERLERMERQMRGIEYSLLSSPTFAFPVHHDKLNDFLESISTRIKEKIQRVCCFSPSHSVIESETREFMEKPSLPLDSTFPTTKQGCLFFYFSCIDVFMTDTLTAPKELDTPTPKTKFSIITTFKTWFGKLTSYDRLRFAIKCSLSLSLAVLFGLIFDKENGCWAGLSIAISFVAGRQAIFTIANTRAQGTAFGSAYGVMCCFLFHFEEVRLLALLPWIVFSCFLRYSKMYGQTGGVAAAIGALLILGRKNYGDPNAFAIARLTEVFIGLAVFIMVELFLQPIRATTLAKNHLFTTLHALQDYIKETGNCPLQKNKTRAKFLELRDKQRSLNHLICELKELVGQAELEPDFWYLPFRSCCFQKLVISLSNTRDLLHFIKYNVEIISQLLETTDTSHELEEWIYKKLEMFQETLASLQVYMKQVSSTDTRVSQEPIDENCRDLEAGALQNPETSTASITELNKAEETTQEEEEDTEENKKVREIITPHLSATGFCIRSLVKELEDVEICVREVYEWENQSSK